MVEKKSIITKFLVHITTEENANKIEDSKQFKISYHTDKTIQWLGNGVYFWDANDDNAWKIGISLVKNKPNNKNKRIKKISTLISVDSDKYLNLDEESCEKSFAQFLKQVFPEGEKLLKMLNMYKKQVNTQKITNNELGKMFGEAINLYTQILKQQNIEIDLVSHYFYHKYRSSLLSAKEEITIRQYCIKNIDLINEEKSENWHIEFIE